MSEVDSAEDTEPPKVYKFVGLVFLWLVPCFVVWVSLGSMLAAPAVWLSELILTAALPDIVYDFTLAGPQALLSTHFGELDGEIVSAQVAGYRLAYPLNTRILTYSLPFYAALHFATVTTDGFFEKNTFRFSMGLLLLYPLLIVINMPVTDQVVFCIIGHVGCKMEPVWYHHGTDFQRRKQIFKFAHNSSPTFLASIIAMSIPLGATQSPVLYTSLTLPLICL